MFEKGYYHNHSQNNPLISDVYFRLCMKVVEVFVVTNSVPDVTDVDKLHSFYKLVSVLLRPYSAISGDGGVMIHVCLVLKTSITMVGLKIRNKECNSIVPQFFS